MKNSIKKIITRFSAIACTAGILMTTACGGATAVAMTIEGADINAGEYIYAQMRANSNAVTKFEELYPDIDTSVTGFDYFTQELEGKSFKNWVIDNTVEILAKRVVYEKMFDEMGLSLTDEEISNMKTSINSTWNDENSNLSSYGISEKTLGLYYESLGISKASYQKMVEGDAKAEKVFHAIYDEGDRAVSAEELTTEFERLYFRYRVLIIGTSDADGNEITDENELKKLEDMGNDFAARLEAGESWLEIQAAYDLFIEERDALAANDEEAEEETDEEEDEELTEDDFDQMMSFSDAELYDSYYSSDMYTDIGSLSLNTPTLLQDEYGFYLVERLDVTEKNEWLDSVKETLLHSLKGEEIDKEIAELAGKISVLRNETAIKRYDPKKTF